MIEQRKLPLVASPITLREARSFVTRHHRHHKAPQGGLFAVAASALFGEPEKLQIVGVAIVGRPVARNNANGWTAEVTRVATDGSFSACSFLYASCWRAARALGYQKLITYTLNTEEGASLRGTGWKVIAETRGGTRSRLARPRVDEHPTQGKLRWEKTDNKERGGFAVANPEQTP